MMNADDVSWLTDLSIMVTSRHRQVLNSLIGEDGPHLLLKFDTLKA